MSGQPGGSAHVSTLVEPVYITPLHMTDEESELVSNEKLFFDDVDRSASIYAPDEITEIWKKALIMKKVDRRKSFDDIRGRLVGSSIFRHDRVNTPPLCMFCMNNDPISTKMCGPLLWLPQFPRFFAFHYYCALMVPGICDAVNPTVFENSFRRLSMRSIRKAAARMRKKKHSSTTKCSVCLMKGALCGCFKIGCKHAYHLPCAIAEGCYISCTDIRAAPVNFGILCKEETILTKEQQTFLLCETVDRCKDTEKRKEFVHWYNGGNKPYNCVFCMKELRTAQGEIFLNKIVFTVCCGLAVSCFKCFQDFVVSTQFGKCCPFRRCELSNEMADFLGIQGIAVDMHKPPAPPTRVACYYSGQSKTPGAACLRHDQIGGSHNYEGHTGARFSQWEKLECQGMCGKMCHLKCVPILGDNWIGQIRVAGATTWYCEDCGIQSSSRNTRSLSPPIKRVKLEPHCHNLPSTPSTIDLDDSLPNTSSHRSPSYVTSSDENEPSIARIKFESVDLSQEPHDIGGESNPICLDDDSEDEREEGDIFPSATPAKFDDAAMEENGVENPQPLIEQEPISKINEAEAVDTTVCAFVHTTDALTGPLPLVFPEEKPGTESVTNASMAKNLTECSNSTAENSRSSNMDLEESNLRNRLAKLEKAVFRGADDQPTQSIPKAFAEERDRQTNLDRMETMTDELITMYKNSRALWETAPVEDLLRLRNIKKKLADIF